LLNSFTATQLDEISHTSKVERVTFSDLTRKPINANCAMFDLSGRIDELNDCLLALYLVDDAIWQRY